MENVLGKIKQGIINGASLSIEKAEEYAKIGKLKLEVFSAKKILDRNYMDIGQKVFEILSDENATVTKKDLLISTAIENIKALKISITDLELQMERISEDAKNAKTQKTAHPVVDDDDEPPIGI